MRPFGSLMHFGAVPSVRQVSYVLRDTRSSASTSASVSRLDEEEGVRAAIGGSFLMRSVGAEVAGGVLGGLCAGDGALGERGCGRCAGTGDMGTEGDRRACVGFC